MTRICLLVLWAACLSPAQPTKCAAVEGERLEARHPAALLPDPPTSPAPAPGARRTFREPELLALGRRHSLTLAGIPDNVCFEWDLQTLDRGLVLEAMRAALPLPNLKLDIMER